MSANIIWYPGSAFARREWIIYLQKEFKGKWIFSDMNEFDEGWADITGLKIQSNTLERPLPEFILRNKVNTMIICNHPGLKSFSEILASGLLFEIKPQQLIYDPGASRIGDIERHLADIPNFINVGYLFKKIIIPPPCLEHQFCQFVRVSN